MFNFRFYIPTTFLESGSRKHFQGSGMQGSTFLFVQLLSMFSRTVDHIRRRTLLVPRHWIQKWNRMFLIRDKENEQTLLFPSNDRISRSFEKNINRLFSLQDTKLAQLFVLCFVLVCVCFFFVL